MGIHMNAGKARQARKRRLWADTPERRLELVDSVLALG